MSPKRLNAAIVAVLYGGAFATPTAALAQAAAAEATALDRIEVTGSRIQRADLEGALPVTVISREELNLSGEVSVADFLRNTTFNSFGSFRPQSGSSAQAHAEVSLRGLGSDRTLVLVDGRRAPISPSSGSGQDLNSIPLAAIERIEVLSDGASAIYGSDAIGGVINIITRKDFNGVEATIGMGNPSRAGGETEEGSVIFGVSGDRGSMLAGVAYNNRGIIFQRERPWSTGGTSIFSNMLVEPIAAPGTLFGAVPGAFVANPEFGARVPGFACNSNGFFLSGSGAGSRCFYDFTFAAADEAEVRNEAMFSRGQFSLSDDWQAYLNVTGSRVKSFGRYAPVPSSPWPGGLPFIPAGSPNHPAVRFPDAGYNANQPYFLRHRFAALGNRDNLTEANVYEALLGFEGRIGELFVDFGIRSSEHKAFEFGRNYVVGAIAQQYIQDGTYNIYDPFGNDPDVLRAMTVTINRDLGTQIEEVFASANLDLFELAGGTSGMAFGVEHRREDYYDLFDSLQEAGQVVGTAGNSASGDRSVSAGYFEVLLPFTAQIEATIAGRYDRYSDYGSDFSPKVALRYQPSDVLTVRASFGQGFRAPGLDILNAAPSFDAETVNDPQTCVAQGEPATCDTQIDSYQISNPDLQSEQSEQWSVGMAWDATDWLNLSLDYYNIEIEDRIAFFDAPFLITCLAGVSACPPGVGDLPFNVSPPQPELGLGIAREPSTGRILFTQTGFANRGTLETSGLDLNLRTTFDFGDWGTLDNLLQISRVSDFRFDGGRNEVGDPSTPDLRAVLNSRWTYGDFSFAWNISHVDSTLSTAGLFARAGLSDYGYSHTLPSWTTHDLQLSWSAPWNGQITVGVNNLADKDPVLDAFDPSGRGFDFNLYDGYGRVPYVRYTQNF